MHFATVLFPFSYWTVRYSRAVHNATVSYILFFFKFNPLCHPPCRDYSSFMPRSTLCDLFHLSVVVHSPSRCCSLLYPNQVLCNRCCFFEYYIIHYAILFTIGYYATRYLIFGYYATLRYYVTCHTITRYYATCCFSYRVLSNPYFISWGTM